MNVAVLSGTAGLLLVLALYVGLSLDGLAVCDLLRNYVYSYAVFILKLGKCDVDLGLALAAYQCLSVSTFLVSTREGSSSVSLAKPEESLSSAPLSAASIA